MKSLERMFKYLNQNGAKTLVQLMGTIITRKRIHNYATIKKLFINKSGIEIGGPSGDFKNHGFIPLYKIVKNLDGCNFSNDTIWEGKIKSGEYYYQEKRGIQFISDATDLSFIPQSTYDFVISSNCLEHVANPLKALGEWIRIIKKNGLLLLILPRKDYCFDRNRRITEFSHLLDDYRYNVKEDDLTHLSEILSLHDYRLDRASGGRTLFRERSLNNFKNRALHHHVYSTSLLKEVLAYFQMEILMTYEDKMSNTILGKKYD